MKGNVIQAGVLMVLLTTVLSASAIPQDDSLEILQVEAEQGDAMAQFNLAEAYANGYVEGQIVAQSYAEAAELLRKGTEQVVWYQKATEQIVARNLTEAAEWYRKAAEQGHARAQYNLGKLYYEGEGVPKDRVEGSKWVLMAAEQGLADAQFRIGYDIMRFKPVIGIPSAEYKPEKWYALAADQGDLNSIYFLGVAFSEYNIDYAEGANWYRMAAERGDVAAQNRLADHYREGLGVLQDYVESYIWYSLCYYTGGRSDCREEMKKVETYLSNEDTSAAQLEIHRRVPGIIMQLKKNVENGRHFLSSRTLSFIYRSGVVVPQDYIESYVWHSVYVSWLGFDDSDYAIMDYEAMAEIENSLSSAELSAAREEVVRRLDKIKAVAR